MKYQFCIRFDRVDVNSSASKAVLDCNKIFSEHGYIDYTFTVDDNSDRKAYYPKLLMGIAKFFFGVKRGSLVGIQYPLLSINSVFKYLISLAKIKGVKFFCVVHDIESLRTGGTDKVLIRKEVDNLNRYDFLIVHNLSMYNWLKENGVVKPMKELGIFDYLTDKHVVGKNIQRRGIVYAGNLAKSTFIYKVPKIDMGFTVFGPGCIMSEIGEGTSYGGNFTPNEVVEAMGGEFGLIWDGTRIDGCDDILGNYLKYNNPHKASLYIAAGLPIIAPSSSAIGKFIIHHKIGFTIESLLELKEFKIDDKDYKIMKANVLKLRERVIHGDFFGQALNAVEENLKIN